MQLFSILSVILIFAPLVLLLSFTPYLTRETISFGVTVSEYNYYTPILRKLRKTFAAVSLIGNGVIIFVCLFLLRSANEESTAIITGVCTMMFVVYSVALHLIFHFKMKRLKGTLPTAEAPQRVKIDTTFRQNKLTYSNYWFLIHIAVIVAVAIISILNYDALPSVVPMKYDFQGNVTSSVPKTYLSVLAINLVQLGVVALLMLVNWSIKTSKQQLTTTDPAQFAAKNIQFRRKWSLFTIITGLFLTILFAFIQINMFVPNLVLLTAISFIVPVVIVLGAIWLSLTGRQGGGKIRNHQEDRERSKEQPVNEDEYWKLGVIYFNPNDPSFTVEKRYGIGWTINFARPLSWVLLLVIIAIVVISRVLSQ
ncbi:DUF1648 domain-containing protein [Paenibacillus illinoisensis]|uniref:DUF5808 domain-containing protein n=2 Tax=Paenibacillus TaxID=44249 RepID=A0A2W0C558_9BACL|nr:DUF5808 domain-containing protein [Paenibacillus illinoisensis]PYY27713.1 Uncharacterized protein PIL02S_04371 [Paenibacillus illinoisensis]